MYISLLVIFDDGFDRDKILMRLLIHLFLNALNQAQTKDFYLLINHSLSVKPSFKILLYHSLYYLMFFFVLSYLHKFFLLNFGLDASLNYFRLLYILNSIHGWKIDRIFFWFVSEIFSWTKDIFTVEFRFTLKTN